METLKSKIGQIGEDMAARHLKRKGFDIVDRNVRRKWGEIDIMAKKGTTLVFVEVKTVVRPSNPLASHIRPEDQLGPQKMHKFKRAAQMYLVENRIPADRKWRLDLVAIELKPDYSLDSLRHVENVLAQ